MKIEVAAAVFSDPNVETELDLFELFRLAWSKRHVLLTNPPYGAPGDDAIRAWVTNHRPKHLSNMLGDILEIELDRAPSDVSRTTLLVEPCQDPEWSSDPQDPRHRVPLSLACRIASAPFRLLLENRRNDAAFLRACAPPEARERLDYALEQGWIEFENAGGVGEMCHRVDEAGRKGREREAVRLWVLQDSDARANYERESGATPHDDAKARWGPSADSDRVREACLASVVPFFHHRLQRRAIENYVPGQVLRVWAGRGDRLQRKNFIKEFFELSPEQRHFFNMKKGLRGDRASLRGVAPVYQSLSPKTQKVLEDGFAGIAEVFHERDFGLDPGWFRDGHLAEIRPLVESIFERM